MEILSPDVFSVIKSRLAWIRPENINIENEISNDDVILFGRKGSGKTALINYLFSNNIRNEMKFMNKIIHFEFDAKKAIEREKEISKGKEEDSTVNESDDKDK